jgi:uncharacterized protein (DUF2235 family)
VHPRQSRGDHSLRSGITVADRFGSASGPPKESRISSQFTATSSSPKRYDVKNLIVCLDGTWNDADSPVPQTNIALLAGLINPRPSGGIQQRVHYDPGVGTGGSVDRIAGGMLGKGLSFNVLAAYRFLSQFYTPGDNIYIFGFSRGAFTARSLYGFLAASGLLRAKACTVANEKFAWNYYRTPPKRRYPADREALRKIANADVRVRFLGVFDTVGALGIPRKRLNWIGRRTFEFHDTEVSSVVDHSCHALAIDENRTEFEAAIWDTPRHRNYQTVEQVWFPGAHANIGGDYEDSGLSDLTLDWMLKRLTKYCPELIVQNANLRPNFQGVLYDSRSWMYWRSKRRPLIRIINRCGLESSRKYRLAKLRPHAKPIGEMLHWSALVRHQASKETGCGEPYGPPNLIAALHSASRGQTHIVGTDGEPMLLRQRFPSRSQDT